ncbi:MAG: flagellar hook-length control protein FliK [Anaerolineales bacterium]|uniref:flagellar hook-length control protein FliK n=1 Tax=Candidatus Villigracilis vicinus TaxID=3140679 RepID=UPI003136CA33|nr:flagellar hook-length control protein FliK [Anaerolineales bacterium]
MMSLILPPTIPPTALEGATGTTASRDSETALSFGEVLKSEEKKLKQEQETNALPLAALFVTTPSAIVELASETQHSSETTSASTGASTVTAVDPARVTQPPSSLQPLTSPQKNPQAAQSLVSGKEFSVQKTDVFETEMPKPEQTQGMMKQGNDLPAEAKPFRAMKQPAAKSSQPVEMVTAEQRPVTPQQIPVSIEKPISNAAAMTSQTVQAQAQAPAPVDVEQKNSSSNKPVITFESAANMEPNSAGQPKMVNPMPTIKATEEVKTKPVDTRAMETQPAVPEQSKAVFDDDRPVPASKAQTQAASVNKPADGQPKMTLPQTQPKANVNEVASEEKVVRPQGKAAQPAEVPASEFTEANVKSKVSAGKEIKASVEEEPAAQTTAPLPKVTGFEAQPQDEGQRTTSMATVAVEQKQNNVSPSSPADVESPLPMKKVELPAKDLKAENEPAEKISESGFKPTVKDEPVVLNRENIPAEVKAVESAPLEVKASAKEVEKESVEPVPALTSVEKSLTSEKMVEHSSNDKIDPANMDVVGQITSQMKTRVKSGETSIRIRLNPEELGAIEVQMTHTAQGVSVSFFTEHTGTSQLLESQANQLRQSLKEAGVQLTNLNISQQHQPTHEGGGFKQSQQFVQNPRREAPQPAPVNEQARPQRIGSTGEIDYLV